MLAMGAGFQSEKMLTGGVLLYYHHFPSMKQLFVLALGCVSFSLFAAGPSRAAESLIRASGTIPAACSVEGAEINLTPASPGQLTGTTQGGKLVNPDQNNYAQISLSPVSFSQKPASAPSDLTASISLGLYPSFNPEQTITATTTSAGTGLGIGPSILTPNLRASIGEPNGLLPPGFYAISTTLSCIY
ncbi:hypothetical protein LBMAG41_15760 [Cyanobium sp.]|nr:hypothetical protein LBMAG41_15760 [Cyanobium sp.]